MFLRSVNEFKRNLLSKDLFGTNWGIFTCLWNTRYWLMTTPRSSDPVWKLSMFLNLQALKYDKGTNKLRFWSFTAPFLDNHSSEVTITTMSVYNFSCNFFKPNLYILIATVCIIDLFQIVQYSAASYNNNQCCVLLKAFRWSSCIRRVVF